MSSGQDSDRFRSRGPSSAANGATAFRRAVAPLAAELGPRLRKRSLSCPELIPEEGSDED